MVIDLNNLLSNNAVWDIILVTATILGAFGGFPQPPKTFSRLTNSSVMQWFLVFILAYQGGASQDPKFALMATTITFVVYYIVRYYEGSDDDLSLT